MNKTIKTSKVLKTGNSLALVIPAKFANKVGVKTGDSVKVETDTSNGVIKFTFLNVRQLSLV